MPPFVPYGRLSDGKMGILVQNGTKTPLVSAIEILDTVPSLSSPDNFDGRTVFSLEDGKLSTFISTPTNTWKVQEGGYPTIGAVNGNPPTIPQPRLGATYYDTSTGNLYLWNGTFWINPGAGDASQIVTQRYTTNGISTTWAIGVQVPITSNYVEVFLDGERQYPNPNGTYDVLGTSIVFSSAPASGKKMMIRALVARNATQNAQMKSVTYTATASQTSFEVPASGVDPVNVFVFENGVHRSYDEVATDGFTIVTQNTKILSISKITSTVAEVVCEDPHHLNTGNTIYFRDTNETAYNSSFRVSTIVSPSTFRVTVSSANPASATGSPTMYWGPPAIPDRVLFNTGRTLNNKIQIRTVESAVAGTMNVIPVTTAALPGAKVAGDYTTGIYGNGLGTLGISSKASSIVTFSTETANVATTVFQRTDAVRVPVGTTAQRPSSASYGDFRANSTIGNPEFYTGSFWSQLLNLRGYAAVVFDGTQANGVLTLTSGRNVASVTKTGTGLYTVAFSSSPALFASANYMMLGNARLDSASGPGTSVMVTPNNAAITSSSFSIQVLATTTGVATDANRISLMFMEF